MIIGVDARGLQEGRLAGVEQYILNILKSIAEIDKENQYLLFYNSWRDVDKKIPDFGPNFKKIGFRIPNKILDSFWRLFNFPKLDFLLGKMDLFFSPNIRIAPLPKNIPNILTIHDLSYVRYPEFFSLKQRIWHWQMNPKNQAKKANRIIAVSGSTKDDLVNYYGLSPTKIKIIYEGVNKDFRSIPKDDPRLNEVRRLYKLPQTDFILSMGTIEPRKNLISLVKAYREIIKTTNIPLVIAGSFGWLFEDLLALIKREKLEKNIYFTNFVDEKDKVYLYNLAKIFVYPSFYEGFGFPPLEAMSCGVPVVSSFVSSLSEVVGDAGLLVDPNNYQELKEAIITLLKDSELASIFIEKGFRQAKKFSWHNAARETLALFNEVTGG